MTSSRWIQVAGGGLAMLMFFKMQQGTTSFALFVTWGLFLAAGGGLFFLGRHLDDQQRLAALEDERRQRRRQTGSPAPTTEDLPQRSSPLADRYDDAWRHFSEFKRNLSTKQIVVCVALLATVLAGVLSFERTDDADSAAVFESELDVSAPVLPGEGGEGQPVVEPSYADDGSEDQAPTEFTPETVLGPGTSWTVVSETDQGYTQEAELTLYPGVQGSDVERMTSGWQAVGGFGDNACLDANPDNDGVTNYTPNTENTHFVFGTLAISDTTDGFEAQSRNWQWTAGTGQGGWTSGPGDPDIDTVMVLMGLGLSDGSRCDGMSTGGFMLSPTWTSQMWGPVPLVIAVDGVYTPKHPAGNMKDIEGVSIGVNLGIGVTINGSDKERITLPEPAK